jgi:hypothetical protein
MTINPGSVLTLVPLLTLVSLSAFGAPASDRRTTGVVRHAVTYSPIDQNSYSRGSRLVYRDRCGWEGAGRAVFVQNIRRTRSVVTVRESSSAGRDRWTRTLTFTLDPGAEQRVGCTYGNTAIELRGYSIVGERSL